MNLPVEIEFSRPQQTHKFVHSLLILIFHLNVKLDWKFHKETSPRNGAIH